MDQSLMGQPINRQVQPISVVPSGFFMLPKYEHKLPATIEGFDRVYAVYNHFMADQGYSATFEFHLKAVQACSYGFGDFKDWVRLHVGTVPLTDTAYGFIKDTLEFILTGRRKFAATTWMVVIKSNPDIQISEHVRRGRWLEIEPILAQLPDDPICMWCSHEGGFKDFILTTAVMFGGIETR